MFVRPTLGPYPSTHKADPCSVMGVYDYQSQILMSDITVTYMAPFGNTQTTSSGADFLLSQRSQYPSAFLAPFSANPTVPVFWAPD